MIPHPHHHPRTGAHSINSLVSLKQRAHTFFLFLSSCCFYVRGRFLHRTAPFTLSLSLSLPVRKVTRPPHTMLTQRGAPQAYRHECGFPLPLLPPPPPLPTSPLLLEGRKKQANKQKKKKRRIQQQQQRNNNNNNNNNNSSSSDSPPKLAKKKTKQTHEHTKRNWSSVVSGFLYSVSSLSLSLSLTHHTDQFHCLFTISSPSLLLPPSTLLSCKPHLVSPCPTSQPVLTSLTHCRPPPGQPCKCTCKQQKQKKTKQSAGEPPPQSHKQE